jgi:Amt family ammonium transporter
MAMPAGAQETPPPTVEDVQGSVTVLGQNLNLLWVVIGALLVIFMQAGFALVETGFTRAKHAAHVVSSNFAIFGLGFIGFFTIGYGLMFGGYHYVLPGYDYGLSEPIGGGGAGFEAGDTVNNLVGSGDWVFLWNPVKSIALNGLWGENFTSNGAYLGAAMGFFLYMVAFMDTVATIPTGSMAERWKWKSFVLWGFFCGAIYYPIFGGWTWGGGWLADLGSSLGLGNGYVDFAGSGIVHAVGGAAALAGCIVLGPRIGKFSKDGTPRALMAHNVPMAMLGTFILLFGWFGFNAASTFAATDPVFAVVALNTAIAAAFGAVTAMFWITKRTGKPDPGMMANGMLAGLVAITAPCAFVDPWAAAVIGLIAGVLVIEAVFFIERKLKLDDPVGAIAVHGVNGTFGVLAVGIFANNTYGVGWNGTVDDSTGEVTTNAVGSLLYGGNVGQFLAQLIGVIMIWTVILGLAYAFFKIQDALTKGGIRSSEEDEIAGLDVPEMGVPAYHDFLGSESWGGDSYRTSDSITKV